MHRTCLFAFAVALNIRRTAAPRKWMVAKKLPHTSSCACPGSCQSVNRSFSGVFPLAGIDIKLAVLASALRSRGAYIRFSKFPNSIRALMSLPSPARLSTFLSLASSKRPPAREPMASL